MGVDERIWRAKRVKRIAAPWIVAGMVHELGTQGVEFDICPALEKIGVVVDVRTIKSALP